MAHALRGREADELGWNRPDYFKNFVFQHKSHQLQEERLVVLRGLEAFGKVIVSKENCSDHGAQTRGKGTARQQWDHRPHLQTPCSRFLPIT